MLSSRLLLAVLSLCSLHIISVQCACQATSSFILRSQTSGLVLDSVQDKVSLEHFTGFDSQLWKFACAGYPSVYSIANVNVVSKVLDVDGNNTLVFAAQDANSLNQQWILNGDGTLLNVGLNLLVGVADDVEQALSLLELTDSNSTSLVKFLLQAK